MHNRLARTYVFAIAAFRFSCWLFVTQPNSNADELAKSVLQHDAEIATTAANILKTGNLSDAAPDLKRYASELAIEHDQLLVLGRQQESSFALLRSGDCLRMIGQPEQALAHYNQALTEAKTAQNIQNQAKIWLSIEKAWNGGLHDDQKAEAALDALAKLLDSRQDLWSIKIDLLGERATLQFHQGNLAEAWFTMDEAVSKSREHRDREKLWLNLYSRSSIDFALFDSFRNQFNALPASNREEWVKCETAAQTIRAKLEDTRNDTAQAVEIARSLGYTAFADKMNSDTSQYDLVDRDFEAQVLSKRLSSKGVFSDAPAVDSSTWEPREAPLLDPALSAVTIQQFNPEVQLVRQAIQNEHRPESVNWVRFLLEGQLEEMQNRVAEAVKLYRQGTQIVEAQREFVADEFSRGTFVAERVELYNRLILNVLQRGDYSEALLHLEQSRSHAILDVLSTAGIRFNSTAEKSLFIEWAAARSREMMLVGTPEASEAEQRTHSIVVRIRQQAPKLLELRASEPVTLETLQRRLRETPCDLVYYLFHEGRLIVWHIGPTHTRAQAFYATEAELKQLEKTMIGNWNLKDEFNQEAAARLFDLLARPVVALMETRHLVIIPPDQLESLPFEALFDNTRKQFLGEQIALSYGPSASVIAALKPARALRSAKLLLVIGPNLETHGAETKAIALQYPHTETLSGNDATFTQLRLSAEGKTAIHVAAHTRSSTSLPLRSVEFAGANNSSGLITAADFFALSLHDVNLFTLAACSAGRQAISGDIYGFAHALLYAGAQTVVLPLWDVSDEAASFWYQAFYANAADHDIPEAARLANIATRQHSIYGAHPRYWAAYRTIGR